MKHTDVKEDKALIKQMVKKDAVKPGMKTGGKVACMATGGKVKSRGAGCATKGFNYSIS